MVVDLKKFLLWFTDPVPCLIWQGGKNRGYGVMKLDGKNIRIAREIYKLMYGPIPHKIVIRHKCDNPPCFNPHHLEPGTQKQNIHDAIERGRFRTRTLLTCKSGLTA